MAYQPPHIVFDCEVLTPMFLGGAEKNTFRLSASSVRGALRYWYRALLGGMGYTSPEVAVQEALVFGSVGNSAIKGTKSPLEVAVMEGDNFHISASREFDGNAINLFRTNTGKGYLWFTAAFGNPNGREGASANNLKFASTGSRFKIALIAPPFRKDAEMPLPNLTLMRASYAMWALVNFGGLGSRSRHGAGSFVVNNIQCSNPKLLSALPPFLSEHNNFTSLEKEIRETLKFLKLNSFLFGTPSNPNPNKKFDSLHENIRIIQGANPTNNPLQAAENIGLKIQKYRKGTVYNNYVPFSTEIKNETKELSDFASRTPREQERTRISLVRARFGLPFNLKFRNGSISANLFNDNKPKRRASPLLVKIIRLKTENRFNYIPVLIYIDSTFNDTIREIKIECNRNRFNASLSNFDPINDLMNKINTL